MWHRHSCLCQAAQQLIIRERIRRRGHDRHPIDGDGDRRLDRFDVVLTRRPNHHPHPRLVERGNGCTSRVNRGVAGADQVLIARVRGLDDLAGLPRFSVHQARLNQGAAKPQLVAGGDCEDRCDSQWNWKLTFLLLLDESKVSTSLWFTPGSNFWA